MLEIVLTSSESDQYSSALKEISKFPLMYMTGNFCRSVYHLTRIHARVGVYKRHMLPLYTSHNFDKHNCIDSHRVNCNEPTPSLLDNF